MTDINKYIYAFKNTYCPLSIQSTPTPVNDVLQLIYCMHSSELNVQLNQDFLYFGFFHSLHLKVQTAGVGEWSWVDFSDMS